MGKREIAVSRLGIGVTMGAWWRRKWLPTPASLPGESQGREHIESQSQTQPRDSAAAARWGQRCLRSILERDEMCMALNSWDHRRKCEASMWTQRVTSPEHPQCEPGLDGPAWVPAPHPCSPWSSGYLTVIQSFSFSLEIILAQARGRAI